MSTYGSPQQNLVHQIQPRLHDNRQRSRTVKTIFYNHSGNSNKYQIGKKNLQNLLLGLSLTKLTPIWVVLVVLSK